MALERIIREPAVRLRDLVVANGKAAKELADHDRAITEQAERINPQGSAIQDLRHDNAVLASFVCAAICVVLGLLMLSAVFKGRSARPRIRAMPSTEDIIAALDRTLTEGKRSQLEEQSMSDYDSKNSPALFGELDRRPDPGTRIGNPIATRNPFSGLLRLIGDDTVVMSLNSQARVAAALTHCLNEQTKSVLAKDALDTAIEKYHARRAGIQHPSDQDELEEERHKRMLVRLRREREVYDAKQETMESLHKLEATEEFKEQKFAAGRARYGAKIAERQVGEAVARSSMEPEPKEAPAPVKPVSIEAVLADFAHKLEQDIDQAEAVGSPPSKCARS